MKKPIFTKIYHQWRRYTGRIFITKSTPLRKMIEKYL